MAEELDFEILPPLEPGGKFRMVSVVRITPDPEPPPTFVCVVCKRTIQPGWTGMRDTRATDEPPICWDCCGGSRGGINVFAHSRIPFSEHVLARRFDGMVRALRKAAYTVRIRQ